MTPMRSLVCHGPAVTRWEEVRKSVVLDDTDAVVKGDRPEVTDGRIPGHEAIVAVESVGPSELHLTSASSA